MLTLPRLPRLLDTPGRYLALMLLSGAIAAAAAGRRPNLRPDETLAREILAELVEIDTTDITGNTTQAAHAMAQRLLDAGFAKTDVLLLEPHERKGNLVARLRGSGTDAPILLLAHLDVVDANHGEWTTNPFALVENNGFYYGRGTTDDKSMAAIWITNFILMKRDGFTPRRDLILALTADEEGGRHNGIRWLIENRPELIDAAFCLNEGAGGRLDNGARVSNEVQLSEKSYQSFRVEVSSAGGHSSVPRNDNAIYQLSRALVRISELEFPVELDAITKSYLQKTARFESGALALDMLAVAHSKDASAARRLSENPHFNAILRTTCVATELHAGHAENALPQQARATVNCRILPSSDVRSIVAALRDAIADDAVTLQPLGKAISSPPSPLSPEVLGALELATEAMWPGVPVVPTMSTGATDGAYLRNAGIPTYGVSGIFQEPGDMRAHGKDERIAIASFFEARQFLDHLTRTLARKR